MSCQPKAGLRKTSVNQYPDYHQIVSTKIRSVSRTHSKSQLDMGVTIREMEEAPPVTADKEQLSNRLKLQRLTTDVVSVKFKR